MKLDLLMLLKDVILTEYPHLQGEIKVSITAKPVLYEVSRGQGITVEIGAETLVSPRRREILRRCGKAAQEIHTGTSSASRVTGLSEINS